MLRWRLKPAQWSSCADDLRNEIKLKVQHWNNTTDGCSADSPLPTSLSDSQPENHWHGIETSHGTALNTQPWLTISHASLSILWHLISQTVRLCNKNNNNQGSVYQLHISWYTTQVCDAIKQLSAGKMMTKYCHYLLKGWNYNSHCTRRVNMTDITGVKNEKKLQDRPILLTQTFPCRYNTAKCYKTFNVSIINPQK